MQQISFLDPPYLASSLPALRDVRVLCGKPAGSVRCLGDEWFVEFLGADAAAQIGLADQRVAGNLGRCALRKFTPVVTDVAAIGDAKRLTHVVRRQQDGDPPPPLASDKR